VKIRIRRRVSSRARELLAAIAAATVAIALAACSSKADDRGAAKIELKSPPAKVESMRHTGPISVGNALNAGAELKPLDQEPVKTIQIHTTHKLFEIAPGARFAAWTFGERVPGPAIRARVGDTIRFSMTNRSDAPVQGGPVFAAPMMISAAHVSAPH
jgi:nitrite reductase (NO-forming)